MTGNGSGKVGASLLGSQRAGHHLPRFADEGLQVALTPEALGVDLVDVLGAGWPGGEPAVVGDDLQAADRCTVARRARELGGDRFAGQVDALTSSARASRAVSSARAWPARRCACSSGAPNSPSAPDSVRQGPLPVRAVISAASRPMMRPSLSVVQTAAVMPQEARPGTLLAAEADEPSIQTGHEPLEPHRHFGQAAAELLHDAIDHAAADQRLADRRVGSATAVDASAGTGWRPPGNGWGSSAPPSASRCRAGPRRDRSPNATSILVLQIHQPRHGERAGAVHADLAVVIHRS